VNVEDAEILRAVSLLAGRDLQCGFRTVRISMDTGHDRLTIRAARYAAMTIDEDLFCDAVQDAHAHLPALDEAVLMRVICDIYENPRRYPSTRRDSD
jgi:hypothetical protein